MHVTVLLRQVVAHVDRDRDGSSATVVTSAPMSRMYCWAANSRLARRNAGFKSVFDQTRVGGGDTRISG